MTEPKPQYARGRPPKPKGEKYKRFPLKLPPAQIAWLRQRKAQTGIAMGAQIQEMIRREMLIEKTVGATPCQTS